MKDETVLDLAPDDLIRRPGPGQQPHSGTVLFLPTIRTEPTLFTRRRRIEDNREIEHDEVVLGKRTIVNHGPSRNRDIHRPHNIPLRRDHHVLKIFPAREVNRRVEFPALRIAFGVGAKRALEGSPEIRALDRVQLIVQLHGKAAAFHDRVGLAAQPDDIRIRETAGSFVEARPRSLRPAPGVTDLIVADETRVIPLGLAVSEAKPVGQAVAGKPMVVFSRCHGVGPDTKESPGQIARNFPAHG